MQGVPEYYQTFETILVAICAPTLAGLKPGSIFSIRCNQCDEVCEKISYWNERLKSFRLEIRLLSCNPRTSVAIVYVFRPHKMEAIVKSPQVQAFLASQGYPGDDLEECLQELSARLQNSSEFPHEIGVFLGYPLADVTGFIENDGQNFLECGMWKVYSNPQKARKEFERYSRCIETCSVQFNLGKSLEELSVCC